MDASFARFVAVGAVLVVALWVVLAIAIYRGPDNPELGEFGFTVLAAFICMLFLAAWVSGLAVGRVLRRSREAGTQT